MFSSCPSKEEPLTGHSVYCKGGLNTIIPAAEIGRHSIMDYLNFPETCGAFITGREKEKEKKRQSD